MKDLTLVKTEEKELSTKDLVDRAGILKMEIAKLEDELAGIKSQLPQLATFKINSRTGEKTQTGHALGDYFKATVTLNKTEKWDQTKLDALRLEMGDEVFFKIFRFEYIKIGAAEVKAACEYTKFGDKIKAAVTITEGNPSIKIEETR
jgi:chaperonin cofactor prefoldin